MGVREGKVESYLDLQFINLGGLTRKWVCPGNDGVNDRICIVKGLVYFVEVKTEDGILTSNQKREQRRLKNVGAEVWTVFGKKDVDTLIKRVKHVIETH